MVTVSEENAPLLLSPTPDTQKGFYYHHLQLDGHQVAVMPSISGLSDLLSSEKGSTEAPFLGLRIQLCGHICSTWGSISEGLV
jgi:hypothetical protein